PIRRFTVPPGAGPAAEVPAVETRAHVRSPLGRRIDHVSLFALAACRLALLDAGLDPTDLPLGRTGLALGSEFGNLDETTTFLDRLFAHGAANPLLFPNLVMNAPLSYTTIELGLTGPSAMLSAGEVSGEAAVAWGAELVAEGGADVCLAGGVDELGEVLHQALHEACLWSPTPRHSVARGRWSRRRAPRRDGSAPPVRSRRRPRRWPWRTTSCRPRWVTCRPPATGSGSSPGGLGRRRSGWPSWMAWRGAAHAV